jgi:4-hydroxybenzoate polyprenyltransferase
MDVLTSPAEIASADSTSLLPLVVDLDGTLLRTDSLIESLFVLARHHFFQLIEMPFWLIKGLANFKRRLSLLAMPDVHTLPYHTDLVAYLRAQKERGRFLVLATGADNWLAQQISRETGLFDLVIASDGMTNLSIERKRERLVEEFGLRRFDYIGSSGRDYPVWRAAHGALLVSPSRRLRRGIVGVTLIERVFDEPRIGWKGFEHALRLHHWVKNALVFLPLAAVHRTMEWNLFGRALLAFAAFSLCASGVYLLNDLFDLPADRRHPRNKQRELASGRFRPAHALALSPLLLGGGLLVGSSLSAAFLGILVLYICMMLAYSVFLKDVPLLDVMILSSGYSLRVLAGALAVDIPLSAWLLAFCACLFLSLALSKRYVELQQSDAALGTGGGRARGYRSSDKPVILAQGVGSGYLSVLILALYTITGIMERYHARHGLFWVLCVLLFCWINYLWLMATRARMHHDQVVFVFKDRVSFWLLAAMGVVAALAI